jgi:hypothetical protein
VSGWEHRRGMTTWERYAVLLIVVSLVVMFVGMWQSAQPGSQPLPTTTTDPSQTFRAPPRMPLGTRPPERVP